MWQMTHSPSRLRSRHRRGFVRSVSPIPYTTKLHPYNTNVISQLHEVVHEAKLNYTNWCLHGFNFKLADTWILIILVFLCHSTKCQYMTLRLVCGVLWVQLGLMVHFLRTLIHTDITSGAILWIPVPLRAIMPFLSKTVHHVTTETIL